MSKPLTIWTPAEAAAINQAADALAKGADCGPIADGIFMRFGYDERGQAMVAAAWQRSGRLAKNGGPGK
jgi:hypothetical protein